MTQADITWCPTCDTGHDIDSICPGRLVATAPERVGWRVAVETDAGTEVHGVMIAKAGPYWRARIVTLPETLWRTSGSGSGLKFACVTATSVESQAKRFILEHCRVQGHRITEMPVELNPGAITAEGLGTDAGRATRHLHAIPARLTGEQVSVNARTSDLSAGGLFVATDRPLRRGSAIRIDLDVDHDSLALDATVVWRRRHADGGRPAGVGLRLINPPQRYVHFTDALHGKRMAAV